LNPVRGSDISAGKGGLPPGALSVGIMASHPIQYQAPWFRALARKVDLTVYFAHTQSASGQAAAGFGTEFEWDVELLAGYKNVFLKNLSKRPSTDRFLGCDTPSIAQALDHSRPDVLIVLGWYLKSYLQAIVACWRAGIPVMVRSDSQLRTNRSRPRRAVKKMLYPLVFRRVNACLAVGTRSAEFFHHYAVPPDKLFIVPHCVDESRFIPVSADTIERRSAVRRRLRIAEDELVLLFVGKLLPRKRPLDLVRALGRLRDTGISARGLYAGDGPLREPILFAANEAGVQVDIMGFVNQSALPDVYRASDMLVLPSDASETWGLVVNEAMCCGLPAVVSDDVGCSPDLIKDGLTGARFATGNADALADAVCSVLPSVRSSAMSGSVTEAMRDWSIDKAVAGTLEAVIWVLEHEQHRRKT